MHLKTLTTNFRDYQSIIGLAAIATGGFTGKLIGAGLIIDDVKSELTNWLVKIIK